MRSVLNWRLLGLILVLLAAVTVGNSQSLSSAQAQESNREQTSVSAFNLVPVMPEEAIKWIYESTSAFKGLSAAQERNTAEREAIPKADKLALSSYPYGIYLNKCYVTAKPYYSNNLSYKYTGQPVRFDNDTTGFQIGGIVPTNSQGVAPIIVKGPIVIRAVAGSLVSNKVKCLSFSPFDPDIRDT